MYINVEGKDVKRDRDKRGIKIETPKNKSEIKSYAYFSSGYGPGHTNTPKKIWHFSSVAVIRNMAIMRKTFGT